MSRSTPPREPHDWVTRAADDAIRHHEKSGASGPVTCSSGASPSGPVHLGNLREFLMPHFVADELRRRGVPVRHLHVWDDYDRFRKVPAGVDPSWVEHIGRPLSAVPDPWGCHPTWSDHYKEPLVAALHELGVDMEEISQTERYQAGVYRDEVLRAVRHRAEIDAVLERHRTKKVAAADAAAEGGDEHAAQEAEAMADSVALDDEGGDGDSGVGYFPFKPYCRDCGRDTTTVTAYDDDTADLAYTCSVCDFHGTTNLATQDEGKLVWKADWPMRWAFEHVDFEPAGMDHATPGSSFTVGHELVESVWDYPRPAWFGYGFVGFAGRPEDVVVGRRRPDRGGRAAGARARDPALALRPPAAQADLRHRLRARGRAAVRRVGRAGAQGHRPREAGRPGARLRAGLRDADRRGAAGARGRRPVPHAGLRRRRDRRLGRPDQPDRRPHGPRPRLGRPARAAAVAGDGLDRGVRAGGRPHDGACRARPRRDRGTVAAGA